MFLSFYLLCSYAERGSGTNLIFAVLRTNLISNLRRITIGIYFQLT